MDIYFCDECGARVNDADLARGHGIKKMDIIICVHCIEQGMGGDLLAKASVPRMQPQKASVGASALKAPSALVALKEPPREQGPAATDETADAPHEEVLPANPAPVNGLGAAASGFSALGLGYLAGQAVVDEEPPTSDPLTTDADDVSDPGTREQQAWEEVVEGSSIDALEPNGRTNADRDGSREDETAESAVDAARTDPSVEAVAVVDGEGEEEDDPLAETVASEDVPVTAFDEVDAEGRDGQPSRGRDGEEARKPNRESRRNERPSRRQAAGSSRRRTASDPNTAKSDRNGISTRSQDPRRTGNQDAQKKLIILVSIFTLILLIGGMSLWIITILNRPPPVTEQPPSIKEELKGVVKNIIAQVRDAHASNDMAKLVHARDVLWPQLQDLITQYHHQLDRTCRQEQGWTNDDMIEEAIARKMRDIDADDAGRLFKLVTDKIVQLEMQQMNHGGD